MNANLKAEAAQYFLAAGMSARAKRLAQEALGLDPTNPKAEEVLRRLEPTSASDNGEGLLGRLRRKG